VEDEFYIFLPSGKIANCLSEQEGRTWVSNNPRDYLILASKAEVKESGTLADFMKVTP